MAAAVQRAGLAKPATLPSLRHSSAAERTRASYDIRTVQQLLGHKDTSTAVIDVHLLIRGRSAPPAQRTSSDHPTMVRFHVVQANPLDSAGPQPNAFAPDSAAQRLPGHEARFPAVLSCDRAGIS